MQRTFLAFLFLIGLSATLPSAKADVGVDFFYDNLSGGSWIDVGDYGYCWQPDVAVNNADWRPYADGYWAYTDEGWTWVSYEDFGWATYHYGRWARLSDAGWVWVPGRDEDLEWGPAWVSWRTGGDYVGWAPLPPTGERLYEGRDIRGQVDVDFDIGPAYYNFVDVRYIGEPVLRDRIIVRTQNITCINQTVNVTNITYKNKIVYNYGPDINVLNQRASRPIQRLTIQRDNNADFAAAARSGGLKTTVRGQSLVVAAPTHVTGSTRQVAPPAVKTRVAKANLDTGWAGVGDAKAKEEFKQKLRSEDPTRIPQGSGAAARGQAATGANANAQPGGSAPAVTTPSASAAAATNAESRRGGRYDRNPGASAAVSATPATALSPGQTGAAGSSDVNAGFERGRGGKRKNRQEELNAAGSSTGASPTAGSATTGSTPDVRRQGRGQYNGRRADQVPTSANMAPSGQLTPPAAGNGSEGVNAGAAQGGDRRNRRYENAPPTSAGQIQGQPPTSVDQVQGQGDRRERRLGRQDAAAQTPTGGSSADAQAQPGRGAATEQEQGQGQGRHQNARRNQGEASPVPSPQ
jgi:hypothetical protein